MDGMGSMILVVICVSNRMKVVEEGMIRNCLRGDIDLILENLHSVIELWVMVAV